MGKFLISEQEKLRILEMHRNATSRQYLFESGTEPGNVIAQAREQNLIDGTQGDMTDIGFQVVGKQGQFYYKCVADFNSTPEQQVGAAKAGAIYDGNFKLTTETELDLKGDYKAEFSKACKNIYDQLAKKRKTFCADPKNKTKKNFAWNCPQPTETPSQVASAQSIDTEKLEAQIANKKITKSSRPDGSFLYVANVDGTMVSPNGANESQVKKGTFLDDYIKSGWLFKE